MNIDKIFLLITSFLLVLTAFARTLKNTYEKKVSGKLGIAMSLLVNIVGGIMLGLLASIYTEDYKWQILATSIGAWSGERSLDLITDLLQEKFNIKKNDNETNI
ncbi:hypothetical protein ACFS5M_13970 [Lacinutrix iliipiscaria]|uniref:Holin n=1 Tax=Lacinutrix iliipiscaria TaxID=1230532 RepID=A0ABW5WUA6_9FLAO